MSDTPAQPERDERVEAALEAFCKPGVLAAADRVVPLPQPPREVGDERVEVFPQTPIVAAPADYTPTAPAALLSDLETAAAPVPLPPEPLSNPTLIDLVHELHTALYGSSWARPESPKEVWESLLDRVRGLAGGRCWQCMKADERDDDEAEIAQHVGAALDAAAAPVSLPVDPTAYPNYPCSIV